MSKVGKWESCGGNFDEAKVHGNSLTIFRYNPYFTFSTTFSSWKRIMALDAVYYDFIVVHCFL